MSNIRRRKPDLPDYHDDGDRRVGLAPLIALIAIAVLGGWLWYSAHHAAPEPYVPPAPIMPENQ